MCGHLQIGLINYGFIFGVLDNTSFGIIRYQESGNTSKVLIGMDMGIDPGFLFHIQETFRICIAAVRQHGNKQIHRDNFTGIRVDDTAGLPGSVYLHSVAGFVIHMHSGLGFVDIVGIMLVELGGLIRQFTADTALRKVLLPQQIQCNTAFLHLLVDVLVVRHLVCAAAGCLGIEFCGNFLLGHVASLWPAKPGALCLLQGPGDRVAPTFAALCDLGMGSAPDFSA